MKSNAVFEVTQTFTCEGNVLEDQAIRLTSEKGQNCPIELRRIRFIRAEDKKEIVLIQVLVAMIAYFLLRLIKSNYPVGTLSLQAIGRLISTNIFHRKSISELIGMAFSKLKTDKANINQQLEAQYA